MRNSNAMSLFCHLSASGISQFFLQAAGKEQTSNLDLSLKLTVLFLGKKSALLQIQEMLRDLLQLHSLLSSSPPYCEWTVIRVYSEIHVCSNTINGHHFLTFQENVQCNPRLMTSSHRWNIDENKSWHEFHRITEFAGLWDYYSN